MSGFNDATNTEELENLLEKNRNRVRNEIIQTVNNKTNYENEKRIVSKYLDKTITKPTSLKEVQCPKCETKFIVNFDEEFRKNLIAENVCEEYEELTSKIGVCDKKIEKLNKKYTELRNQLVLVENSISNNKEAYDNYLKSRSLRLILDENKIKLGELEIKITSLKNNLIAIKSSIKEYNQKKIEADKRYNIILNKLFAQL